MSQQQGQETGLHSALEGEAPPEAPFVFFLLLPSPAAAAAAARDDGGRRGLGQRAEPVERQHRREDQRGGRGTPLSSQEPRENIAVIRGFGIR